MSDPIPQQTGRESVSFAGADGARTDAWLYRPDPHVSTGTTIVMARGRQRSGGFMKEWSWG
jgi:cephalosporin-C deacetylase-like acetyl esterase